jgi:hypothetical protein
MANSSTKSSRTEHQNLNGIGVRVPHEDRSRVRHRNAALVLGLFRRLVVSVAQTAIAEVQTSKTRWTVRRYQQRFAHRNGGPQRLQSLAFANSPLSWRLPK